MAYFPCLAHHHSYISTVFAVSSGCHLSHLVWWLQVAENPVEDLAVVQEDVALKLSLWNNSAEFETIVADWKSSLFESLDLAAMEETIARYDTLVHSLLYHEVTISRSK